MNAGAHRQQFHDKALLYLFSFDVESNMDRQMIGFINGGVRVNVLARPGLTRVYHVYRSRTVPGLGYDTIEGELAWGGDFVFWREDDIEFSQVRAALLTSDGAWIHMTYDLVAYLGPGGFRRIVSEKERVGKPSDPVNWPVIGAPRLQTTHPKYRWIMNYQCVSFGVVQIVKSEIRRLTYDVYAMT